MPKNVERKPYVRDSSRERSIRILLNGRQIAVSQSTPDNLRELAVGFLLAEGLISDRLKLRDIDVDVEAAWVNVLSDEDPKNNSEKMPILSRVTSSGCAQSSLLRNADLCPPIPSEEPPVTLTADSLLAMMEQLCQLSPRRNGGEGVHGCGMGKDGTLLCVREDIGRHNAMDKLIGQAWLDRIPMGHMALFTTGRVSYEMALKAIQVKVPILVSHKSVTDSAIELAEELNLTIVGKCRDDAMQVLSHHERVIVQMD